MDRVEKCRDVLGVVVSGASVIVGLAAIWAEFGPKIVAVIKPFINDCKKLVNN